MESWLTVKKAAPMTGMSEQALYTAIREKKFPAIRIDIGLGAVLKNACMKFPRIGPRLCWTSLAAKAPRVADERCAITR